MWLIINKNKVYRNLLNINNKECFLVGMIKFFIIVNINYINKK